VELHDEDAEGPDGPSGASQRTPHREDGRLGPLALVVSDHSASRRGCGPPDHELIAAHALAGNLDVDHVEPARYRVGHTAGRDVEARPAAAVVGRVQADIVAAADRLTVRAELDWLRAHPEPSTADDRERGLLRLRDEVLRASADLAVRLGGRLGTTGNVVALVAATAASDERSHREHSHLRTRPRPHLLQLRERGCPRSGMACRPRRGQSSLGVMASSRAWRPTPKRTSATECRSSRESPATSVT
jgi:hypothetical protein